jgi:hypothetical protein
MGGIGFAGNRGLRDQEHGKAVTNWIDAMTLIANQGFAFLANGGPLIASRASEELEKTLIDHSRTFTVSISPAFALTSEFDHGDKYTAALD